MSGALGYVEIETAVEKAINSLETHLYEYFGSDDLTWSVAFNETCLIAVEAPAAELIELTISGRLTEPVPAYATDDSGEVSAPLFPIGTLSPHERIPREDTDGYEELITRDVVELHPLQRVDPSSKAILEAIVNRHQVRGIVDAVGNAWNERDSALAAAAASHSRRVDDPDIVVSFDILQTFAYVFQHQRFLTYDEYEDGERVNEDRVDFERVVELASLAPEELPEVGKVYVHQDARVAASDYEITSKDIRDALTGRVLEWGDACTVPDPSGNGLRTRVGSIAKIQLADEQDAYHGFVRAAANLSVSRLFDFYTALRVPTAPYLTHELTQETADWDRDREQFSGWSAAENGFVLNGIDERRNIRRSLYASGYWVVKGQHYRNKREFESDVQTLQQLIERELDCETALREFSGTRISKTPILQSEVLDQIREEARSPPDRSDLVEAVAGFARNSTEVEGIDRPLFPSDLSEFVADTSIIDAGVITTLVSDGDLYDATIVVPDVVLEEIHRQVERADAHGEAGLEELKTLRGLSEAGIVALNVVETDGTTDTTDGVATDQTILRVARKRDVPLCSADQTLLELADVSGVVAYPLQQEMSVSEQLITNALQQRDEVPLPYLLRVVYNRLEESKFSEKTVHNQLFTTPSDQPTEDIAAELRIREAIDQLERNNTLYRRDDVVGLVEDVAVVPTLQALKEGTVSQAITTGDIFDEVAPAEYKTRLTVVLPSVFEQWASLRSNPQYLEELRDLEDLNRRNEIEIAYQSLLPQEGQAVFADHDQFSNLMAALPRKSADSFPQLYQVDTDGEEASIHRWG